MSSSEPRSARKGIRGRIALGVFCLLVAGLIAIVLAGGATPDQVTKLGLNPGAESQAIHVPDVVVPTRVSLWVLAALSAFVGGWQLARGFKGVGLPVAIVAFALAFAFVIWAAKGRSISLVGMLSGSVLGAIPILLGALSGCLCERAAVVNIAIEGMMLTAAMIAAIVGTVSHSLALALVSAMLASGVLAMALAVLSIKFKVDQIISGTVINIFAVGLTSYFSRKFLADNSAALNSPEIFRPVSIPILSKIPIIGPMFFEVNVIVYLAFLLVIAVHVMLFYTRWGLRTRAVGEHPLAADTLGINVYRTRYINVLLGGLVAGVGGAFFTIGSVGGFDKAMTAGKGFIGLAALIFGKWTPFGAFGSSLIFGFTDSLQTKLQILQIPIPSGFLLMLPYLVTMIVLAGVVGRAVSPAADGKPYEKQ
jgi:general nucleoside transport system permease protein